MEPQELEHHDVFFPENLGSTLDFISSSHLRQLLEVWGGQLCVFFPRTC